VGTIEAGPNGCGQKKRKSRLRPDQFECETVGRGRTIYLKGLRYIEMIKGASERGGSQIKRN
jgi:hypothetical protein